MAITANLSRSLSVAGTTVGGVVQSVTSDDAQSIVKAVPANSTDYEIDVEAITMANAVAYGMDCSAAATVKSNSSGSPVDTLTLLANDPLIYVSGDPAGNKFISASSLTKFYVTCVLACTFKFVALVDVTPVG